MRYETHKKLCGKKEGDKVQRSSAILNTQLPFHLSDARLLEKFKKSTKRKYWCSLSDLLNNLENCTYCTAVIYWDVAVYNAREGVRQDMNI